MGTYEYVATATAEGGASGTISQAFWVTQTCTATERIGAQKEFVYEVPASGQRDESFPASSADYVLPPRAGCQ